MRDLTPCLLLLFGLLSLDPVACRTKGDGELDDFLSARCRLLVEPDCLTSQDASCGNVVSYESQADCEEAGRDALGDCAEDADDALAGLDELDQCLDALATFDCLDQPVCDDGLPVYNSGACHVVTSLIAETCP